MLNRFYALLTAVISTAGLVSCSADKTKQDDWQVSAPIVKSATGAGPSVDLHSTFVGEVAADSVFSFASNQPEKLANIAAHSVCSRKGEKSESDRTFSGELSIRLASLIPDSILYSTSNDKFICQFSFEITNSDGSKRTFESHPITVGSLKMLENFPLEKDQYNSEELAQVTLASVQKSAARLGAETSTFTLACDQFRNSRTRQQGQTDQEILEALSEGSITDLTRPNLVVESAMDSRYRSSVQNCKLVMINEARGRTTDIFSSSPFLLTFPVSKPEISAQANTSFKANTNLQGLELVGFKIKNPDPVTVAYELSASDLSFQAETWALSTSELTTPNVYSIMGSGLPVAGWIELTSLQKSGGNGAKIVVDIPAHGEAEISLKIASSLDCSNRNLHQFIVPGVLALNNPACANGKSCQFVDRLAISIPAAISIGRQVQFKNENDSGPRLRDLKPIFSARSLTLKSSAIQEVTSRGYVEVETWAPLKATMENQFHSVSVCN